MIQLVGLIVIIPVADSFMYYLAKLQIFVADNLLRSRYSF